LQPGNILYSGGLCLGNAGSHLETLKEKLKKKNLDFDFVNDVSKRTQIEQTPMP